MKHNFMILIFLLLLTGLVATASSEDGHDHPAGVEHEQEVDDDDDHAGHDHGSEESGDDHVDIVQLSPAELAEFGIKVGVAESGIIETRLELPGEVRPNDERLAHIVPRYSGIVTEVRTRIGDYVERGQVLAIVESDATLAPFEVKTLISGTIIDKHITLGEAVSREDDAFVIADLSSVWIELTVYQHDLHVVRIGQQAQVYVGHDAIPGQATISYITPIVDEQTRTATARVVLTNTAGFWRPGMFVTARVLVDREDVPVAIPRTALHTFEERTVVFLETPEGFRPGPVTLGRQGETLVEVTSGLVAGDHYVMAGGFTIKAELGKGSFGDGHGH